MPGEQRDPTGRNACDNRGGRGARTTTPLRLQDLRRRIDVKAPAAPAWRFWGLDGHGCKRDTLRAAYRLAPENHGAPGMDGGTVEASEADGVAQGLQQLQDARVTRPYRPRRLRQKASPKEGGTQVRGLSRPTLRDRVVQGACKRRLEPIGAADFQPGSYGYRPKRSAQDAGRRVAAAMVQDKTRVLAVDVHASCDTLRPHLL